MLQSNQSFVPGQEIHYNGWVLQMNGTPRPGDAATIQPTNTANLNANAGNARALLALRDAKIIDEGKLVDGYANLTAQIGVRVQSANFSSEVSQTIASNLAEQKSKVSAVNLDEEAARLLQFQQAYQASAKILQVAQRMMDTVLQELR